MKLNEKALLVNPSIGQWEGRKTDKKITIRVNNEYAASQDAGKWSKYLLAKSALREIQQTVNAARTYHYDHTLPWFDDGSRILAAISYVEYMAKMAQFKERFQELVRQLMENYATLIGAARGILNGMFDIKDYLPRNKLEKKFHFEVVVSPLPDAADFRVQLANEEIAAIQEQIEQRTIDTGKLIEGDIYKRLSKVVGHMVNKLADPEGQYKDTLIGNLQELVDLIPGLNITGNADIEAVRQKVAQLASNDPQDLRDNPGARTEVAKDAKAVLDDITAKMSAYFSD